MSLVTARKGYKKVPWLFGKEIEIPEEWEVKKFEDIAKIRRGASPRPIEDSKYFGKGRGWIRISDVTKSKKYLKQTTDFLSDLGESKSVAVNDGDVILSIAASVGKPIIIKMKACIHDGFITFTNMSNTMNNEFLYYLLLKTKSTFTNIGQHGTQSNINSEIVSKTNFLNPPLHEQQKIAIILSNVDNLIESTEKVIIHSKKVKTGLMQKLLTRGIGHTKFKKVPWHFNSELQIPEEWELLPIKKISQVNSKSIDQQYDNKKINYADISSIKNFKIQKFEKFLISERPSRAQRIIQNGDILVSTVRPYLQAFSVVEDNESNLICSTGFTVLKPLNSHITNILFNFIKSKIFETYVIRLMEGMAYPAITSKIVGDCLIPIPTNENEINSISETFANVDTQIESQTQYKEKLQKLKKSLMQKLLTGEVRI
jgi:type I restriction enzyme, S subunit